MCSTYSASVSFRNYVRWTVSLTFLLLLVVVHASNLNDDPCFYGNPEQGSPCVVQDIVGSCCTIYESAGGWILPTEWCCYDPSFQNNSTISCDDISSLECPNYDAQQASANTVFLTLLYIVCGISAIALLMAMASSMLDPADEDVLLLPPEGDGGLAVANDEPSSCFHSYYLRYCHVPDRLLCRKHSRCYLVRVLAQLIIGCVLASVEFLAEHNVSKALVGILVASTVLQSWIMSIQLYLSCCKKKYKLRTRRWINAATLISFLAWWPLTFHSWFAHDSAIPELAAKDWCMRVFSIIGMCIDFASISRAFCDEYGFPFDRTKCSIVFCATIAFVDAILSYVLIH